MSIEIYGRCDGCGRDVTRNEIGRYTTVPVFFVDRIVDFDFCPSCFKELSEIKGNLHRQISELQKRHGIVRG